MLKKVYEVADAPIFEMGHGNMFCITSQLKNFGYFSVDMVLCARNEVLEAWYAEDDLERAAKFGERFFLDEGKYSAYMQHIVTLLNSFPLDEQTYSHNLAIANDIPSIKAVVSDISKKQCEVFGYFNTTNPQFTAGVEDLLIKQLRDKEVEDVNNVVAVLSSPSRKSTLEIEREEFYMLIKDKVQELRILESLSEEELKRTHAKLLDAIHVHSQKYRHLAGNEGADEWGMTYYMQNLKSVIEENVHIADELRTIETKAERHEKEKAEVIARHKIGSEIIALANILGDLGHYRLELRLLWSSYFRLLRKAIYKLSDVLEVPAYDLMALTPDELNADVTHHAVTKRYKTRERYKGYFYAIKDHKVVEFYIGDEALAHMPKDADERGKSELSGMVAFKGVVEGKAYVLNWGDPEFNKKVMAMPKGAIIVIGNTRPSLMPAIRKASAIVTDEGGITSHAAIVSRELRIPCIIGTRVATKSIVMGTKIRVDAEKGTVTLL